MRDILTAAELNFLSSQGLSPDDVMDVRGMPQWLWFQRIEENDKTVALGSRCRAAGHRLRSRRGHCVQCDTSKLAYQARFSATQYVYIAGSRSYKLIKIGTCGDVLQRENQMRVERYGGIPDWEVIYSVRVTNAGALEDSARSRLGAVKHAIKIEGQYKKEMPELGLSDSIGQASPVQLRRRVSRVIAGLFVSDPKYRPKQELHSDGKIEIFYKPVAYGFLCLFFLTVLFIGVVYDNHSMAVLVWEKAKALCGK